jgi:tetratricopeptide (TPR) repeat protein
LSIDGEFVEPDSLPYYRQLRELSISQFNVNNTDSAFRLGKEVLTWCERQKAGNKAVENFKAVVCNTIGVYYQLAGQNDSSISLLLQAEQIFLNINKKGVLPDVYINLADNYYANGDFPQSVNYYSKALSLSDSLDIKENIPPICIGLGTIYANLKNYKLSDYYFQQVENRIDSLDQYTQYLFANSRGNYYYQTKEYNRALQWFMEANRFIQGHLLATRSTAISEANIAEIYLLMHQPDSAKHYLDRAAKILLAPGAGVSEQFYVNGLYASLSLEINDLQEAEKRLLAFRHVEQINPTYLYYNNRRLETLYARKGDYQKAYEYQTQAGLYNDSVLNITAQNNIAEIEMRYRQDTILLKRDALIAQKERKVGELRNINRIAIIAGISFLITGAIFMFYYKKRKDLQYSQRTAVITELRMENVRNRISPHFMFNVINAVLPSLRQHNDLNRPLRLLVKSIRNNLSVSEKIAVPLKDEIDMVSDFIELRESLGYKPASIQWNIGENADMNRLIPSMCIQIPVENALKYAFTEVSETNFISINVSGGEKNQLSIEIEDNGIGYVETLNQANQHGTGNGLKILYKTIELLNTKNQQKMIFTIRNRKYDSPEQCGTIVSIYIPCNYKYAL